MISPIRIFVLLLAVMTCVPAVRADRNLNRLGWELTFHDEFDEGPVNFSKWNLANGPNSANEEKQWYTPDNVFVDNGNLVLKSERRTINGWQYASGKVDTAGRFAQQYGYWEVRAKLPYGQGYWPAHWMLGYNGWPPEIDIMEYRGNTPNYVQFSMHWGPLPPGCYRPWECGQTQSAEYWGPNFSEGFHTFAVEWDWWGLNWFVDNTYRGGSWGGVHEPMWLILNTAVGGVYGGDPDGSTPFPGYHDIDWVRVWKRFAGRTALNPGFETGSDKNSMNWNRYDADFNVIRDETSAHAHSGTSAARLSGRSNGAPNNSGLFQDIWASPGEFVQVSVWCQKRPGDPPTHNNRASLKLEFLDGNEALIDSKEFTRIIDATSPGGYQWFALRDKAPPDTVRARIVLDYFQDNDSPGAVIFDDTELRAVGPNGSRPLLNEGFEWGLATTFPNWTPYPVAGNQVHSINPANVRTGGNALAVVGLSTGGPNHSGLSQEIPAKAGEEWRTSVWAKNATGNALQGANQASLILQFLDEAGEILQSNVVTVADSTTPQTFTSNVVIQSTAPTGTATVRILLDLFQDGNAPGAVIFDDAALEILTDDAVLLNPGLENETDPFIAWTVYDQGFNVILDPVATNARSGTNAVQLFGRFNSATNESGLFQDVVANPGEVWEARVWARNRPGDGAQGQNRGMFKLEFVDGGGTVLDRDELSVVTSNSPSIYQEFVLKRSAPSNAVAARIVLAYVQVNFADGSVNFDDASLKRLTPEDPRPVLNAGFEGGDGASFVNWPRYPATAANIVHESLPTNVYAGAQAVQMYGRFTGGTNSSGLFQDFPATPGEFWQASVWAQNRVGDPPQGANHAKLKIEFVNDMDVRLATNQLTILNATAPQFYQPWVIRRQAPPGTTRARVVLEYVQVANANGSVNFDEAAMKIVTADDPDRPLLNPGFEVGEGAEFANWVRYAPQASVSNVLRDPVESNAFNGSVAVQMFGAFNGSPANSSGIFQDIPARAGELWQASIWARNRPADLMQGANKAWLKLEFLDSTGGFLASQAFVMLTAGSPTNYAWFALREEAPAGTALARIVVQYDQVDSAGGAINIDDASLRVVNAIDEPPTLNGDMEDLYSNGDMVNWIETSAGGGGNVVTDGVVGNARSGTSAVKISGQFNSSFNASSLHQELPAAAGQLWRASAWCRNRPGDALQGGNYARLRLEFLDASRQILVANELRTADATTSTNYQQSAILREAPPGTAWARIRLEMIQINFAGGAVNFDDADLSPISVLTGTQDVHQALLAGPLHPGIGEAVVFTGKMAADPSVDLHMLIGGTQAGSEFDQILVGSTAILSGGIHIDLPAGFSGEATSTNFFVPRPGDVFELLAAPSVTGTFTRVSVPNGIGNVPAFSVHVTPTNVYAQVDRELDTDRDGLADFWELKYFGFPNAGSPGSDPDGDHVSNWSEMIAGTDPTNVLSFFRVHDWRPSDTNLVIEWESVPGKLYSVWQTTNLVSGMHGIVTNDLPATSPRTELDLSIPPGPQGGFWLEVDDPALR